MPLYPENPGAKARLCFAAFRRPEGPRFHGSSCDESVFPRSILREQPFPGSTFQDPIYCELVCWHLCRIDRQLLSRNHRR